MSYEFTAEENERLNNISENLRAFTVPLLLVALLELALIAIVFFLYRPESGTILYTFFIALGVVAFYFVFLAGKIRASFHLIIGTEGADIDHLMSVLEKLKKSLFMGVIMSCLLCVLLIVSLANTVMTMT
jgi:hypothetical protein